MKALVWVVFPHLIQKRFNFNSQDKFKTSMLKSSLSDYSDAYIHFKRTITSPNTGTAAATEIRGKNKT